MSPDQPIVPRPPTPPSILRRIRERMVGPLICSTQINAFDEGGFLKD